MKYKKLSPIFTPNETQGLVKNNIRNTHRKKSEYHILNIIVQDISSVLQKKKKLTKFRYFYSHILSTLSICISGFYVIFLYYLSNFLKFISKFYLEVVYLYHTFA